MTASVITPSLDFAFIAFDHSSGKAMAHGQRAIDALDRADRIGPNIEIEILAVGQAGVWLWNNKTPLVEARSELNKMSMITDWADYMCLMKDTSHR